MSGCTLPRPDPAASSAGSRPESAASQRGAARSGAGRRGGGPAGTDFKVSWWRCRHRHPGTPHPRTGGRPPPPPRPFQAQPGSGRARPRRFYTGLPWRAPMVLSLHPLESFWQPRGGGAGPVGGVSGSRLGFGGHSCLLLSTDSFLPAARFYARPRKAVLGHPPPRQLLCALRDVHSPPPCSPMTSHLHQRSPLVGKARRSSRVTPCHLLAEKLGVTDCSGLGDKERKKPFFFWFWSP